MEELARADGYRTLVAGSGEDADEEVAQVQALAAWRPAGVLVIPTDDRFRAREVLAASGIPVVAVDRVTAATPVDTISIDNTGEARCAAAHLVELGHRRAPRLASARGAAPGRCLSAGADPARLPARGPPLDRSPRPEVGRPSLSGARPPGGDPALAGAIAWTQPGVNRFMATGPRPARAPGHSVSAGGGGYKSGTP